jgi:hypothetical protein
MVAFIGYDIFDRERQRRAKARIQLNLDTKKKEEESKEGASKLRQPASPRNQVFSSRDVPIIKICITGGPCAGKTSG